MTPCPFCDGTDIEYIDYLADAWMECVKCEAQGPHSHEAMVDKEKARAEALRLWENRKTMTQYARAVRSPRVE